MALVATKDQFIEDVHGVRRLIKANDPVPAGLFDLSKVDTKEVDTRSLARPVIDADASQPSGTAADPAAGITTERADELQRLQREAAEGTSASRTRGAKRQAAES